MVLHTTNSSSIRLDQNDGCRQFSAVAQDIGRAPETLCALGQAGDLILVEALTSHWSASAQFCRHDERSREGLGRKVGLVQPLSLARRSTSVAVISRQRSRVYGFMQHTLGHISKREQACDWVPGPSASPGYISETTPTIRNGATAKTTPSSAYAKETRLS